MLVINPFPKPSICERCVRRYQTIKQNPYLLSAESLWKSKKRSLECLERDGEAYLHSVGTADILTGGN